MATELEIHPRLQSALHVLAPDERAQLEANILADGRVLSPILYWHDGQRNWIVDGHNRYDIATRHKIPFRAEPMPTLESLEDCLVWLCDHHLGRRHFMDKLTVRKLRGECYLRTKRGRGGDHRAMAQIDPLVGESQSPPPPPSKSTAETIAEQHKVSTATVKRDAKLVQSLDKLAPKIRDKYESGDLKLSDDIIHALASVGPDVQMLIARDVRVSGIKWREACAQHGALKQREKPAPQKTQKTQDIPPTATGGTPSQGVDAGRPGDKGQRMDSPAAGFSPQPPQLINEARDLFHRMTPAQRQQVHVLWGEWLADSQADQQVVSREETTAEQPEKVDEQPKPKEKKRTVFQKPTIEEIQAYCYERNNGISGQEFYDFYEARGWKLTKGVAMTDWKAAVRTWEKNQRHEVKNGKRTGAGQVYDPHAPAGKL